MLRCGGEANDFYSVSKVLNESDMPPLLVVRDMLKRLRLLRRRKDVLVPTPRGRDFLRRPQAFFGLIATGYLYMLMSITGRRRRLSVIGCVGGYPDPAEMTVDTWAERSALRYDIIRPLPCNPNSLSIELCR